MSAAARRQRLIRIRAVEHRSAIARQMAAETALLAVTQIAGRVRDLRAGIGGVAGICRGRDVQGTSELVLRLDRAAAGLLPPLAAARATCAEHAAARMAAHVAEERVRRLDNKVSACDAQESERRAATFTPVRRVSPAGRP